MLLPATGNAQQWSGIVDPARAINWSKAGVPGGIPNRTTICTTLSPGATAAQISTAIKNCPSGQVVFLNAGTYSLNAEIVATDKSGVTLRGAGANQTKLVFTKSSNCWGQPADICFNSSDVNYAEGPSNTATISAGATKGSTQVTLSSTANLKVGKQMIIDQQDDLSDGGLIYNCEQSKSLSANQNPPCNDDSNATGGDSGAQRGDATAQVRGLQQLVVVTAISGNTVTFTPALYSPSWRASQNPGAWWANGGSFAMGVENLSVDHTNSDAFLGTMFFNCQGCWATGIASINSDRDHFAVYWSGQATIANNYMYGTKNAVSQSYGVEIYGSSDTLVQNNISQKVAAPYMINSDCEGCVFAYNFGINDYYAASSNWESQTIYMHSLTQFILVEGNQGNGVYFDLFHGTHNFITAFRNRFDGDEANNGSAVASHTNPFIIYPYSRYLNIIGNVLGTSGYHTGYIYTTSPEGNAGDLAINVVGTGTESCCKSGDPLVQKSLMLWGNYDTVNNAVRFVSTEIPTAAAGFPNPIPTSQALPASFFLAAKPNWWPSAKAWPPIGPDVSGGNIAGVGGHAFSIPAADCYSNIMGGPANGVGNPLTFNASTCYSTTVSGPGPNPPTGLAAIGH